MSADLPSVLPLFPLRGVVLLPGGRLPLQVFEPRYRNMLEDALEGESYIGVIQPRETVDMFPDDLPPEETSPPDLYEVGCAGLVERCDAVSGQERYLILLRGVRRFRIGQELNLRRGYRRVEVDYDEFAVDQQDPEPEVSGERLMQALADFGADHRVSFELDSLRDLPALALLNSVAMALPFPPDEKQALLEAPDVDQRFEMLLTLMNMGLEPRGESPSALN